MSVPKFQIGLNGVFSHNGWRSNGDLPQALGAVGIGDYVVGVLVFD
jgi:hypothetical protein